MQINKIFLKMKCYKDALKNVYSNGKNINFLYILTIYFIHLCLKNKYGFLIFSSISASIFRFFF